MHFSGRGGSTDIVASIRREKHPERYVPLTEADTADVLDLVSAFVWPVAGGVTPDICGRTLPLMDGKRRFDIALAFSRLERLRHARPLLPRPRRRLQLPLPAGGRPAHRQAREGHHR